MTGNTLIDCYQEKESFPDEKLSRFDWEIENEPAELGLAKSLNAGLGMVLENKREIRCAYSHIGSENFADIEWDIDKFIKRTLSRLGQEGDVMVLEEKEVNR